MAKHIVSFVLFALIAIGAIAATTYFVAPDYVRGQFTKLTAHNQPTAYVLLRIDSDAVVRARLEQVADQMGAVLRVARIPYTGRAVVDDAARLQLVNVEDMPRARQALAQVANAAQGATDTLAFTERENGVIEARLPFAVARDAVRVATAQTVLIINRRVNPSNSSSITVRAVGDDQILVEALGETNASDLRTRIGSTGQLAFHLVRDDIPIEDIEASRVRPGVIVAPGHPTLGSSAELVADRPVFTGARLVRVQANMDPQTERFVLAFGLDGEGTRLFCRVTRDNIGKRFAVLLDGQVITAPMINEPICGGSGQISGNFTRESATALVAVLRAGALPAPLTLIEEGVRPPAL